MMGGQTHIGVEDVVVVCGSSDVVKIGWIRVQVTIHQHVKYLHIWERTEHSSEYGDQENTGTRECGDQENTETRECGDQENTGTREYGDQENTGTREYGDQGKR